MPPNVISVGPQSGAPKTLVVLLHGVGDSARGFEGVARELARTLPTAEFLVPDGFHPFDGGGAGRQWFSRVGMSEENRPERLRAAALEVSAWVDAELEKRHLPPECLVIGGFSQGAMVSSWFALHRSPPPAAVVMLSGRIAEPPGSAPSVPSPHPPVFIGHGTNDRVMPVSSVEHAAKHFHGLGVPVTQRVYPGMEHQISRAELADVEAFLKQTLGE